MLGVEAPVSCQSCWLAGALGTWTPGLDAKIWQAQDTYRAHPCLQWTLGAWGFVY